MNISRILAVVSVSAISFAASATHIQISGIQTNVSEASFLSSGWTEVSAVSTGDYETIASAVAGIRQINLIAGRYTEQ